MSEPMKRVILALLLGVLAASAWGQTGSAEPATFNVICPAPCFVAPIFRGSGGFVGESVRGRSGTVDFALSCGDSVTTISVRPDADGIVRQVFSRGNGLACDAESGRIDIAGLKPGGWYWINDELNSAVSSLLEKSVLGNPPSEPFDPGGVTITSLEDGAASFVKDEMSGRVGIIPHVVPVPFVPLCGGAENVSNHCELRATFEIVLKAGDTVLDRDVVRGGEDGATYFIITASLAGEGYIPTDPAMAPVGAYRIAGPGSTEENPVGTPGVNQAFPSADIGIEAESGPADRCAETNAQRDVPVTVVVTATNPETGPVTVPGLPEGGITRTFSVSCPPPE